MSVCLVAEIVREKGDVARVGGARGEDEQGGKDEKECFHVVGHCFKRFPEILH